jgi:hypothetical protein
LANASCFSRLLFLATLIFHGHTYRLWRQEHKKPSVDNATVEMKAQGTPFMAAQDTTNAQPAHPQYTDQQQYQSQVYPQQPSPAAYPQHPDVYSQQPGAYPPQHQQQQQPAQYQDPNMQTQPQAGYAAFPDPSQYNQQQPYSPQGTPAPQQAYSPQGTPAPGQPYYPPQHPQQQ